MDEVKRHMTFWKNAVMSKTIEELACRTFYLKKEKEKEEEDKEKKKLLHTDKKISQTPIEKYEQRV